MQIQEVMTRSDDLSTWLDHSIDGVKTETTLRGLIAAGCFDIVHEHRKAIILLVKNKFVGSAFSLFRPELETFVRGVWVLRCATESELVVFENDKLKHSITDLIAAIEKLDPWDVGILSGIHKLAWSSMCSYAHGGALQISRRFRDDKIAPNYSDESVVEVINSSNVIALMAACEIAALANAPNLGNTANEKLADYFPAQP